MTVFTLSRATEDYTTDYELYGVFSSIEKARAHAKSEDSNLKIEGVDEITRTDFSYWTIDVWQLDGGMEVL